MVGDPTNAKRPEIGPLSRPGQRGVPAYAQIKDAAVGKGARLLYGGKVVDRKGYFLEPAVLVDYRIIR